MSGVIAFQLRDHTRYACDLVNKHASALSSLMQSADA